MSAADAQGAGRQIRWGEIEYMATTSTRLSQHVNAPRAHVYRALLDAHAVATWMVPDGMTSHVHAFDAHEGGSFRISLTYDTSTGTGKSLKAIHTTILPAALVERVPSPRQDSAQTITFRFVVRKSSKMEGIVSCP
jgi:hypothetical protein